MSPYTSIRNQSCPNTLCGFYGDYLKGNVWVHSRKNRRLKCKACCSTWVAYRTEPTYRLRTDVGRFSTATGLLQTGLSVRKTADIVGVSPSTVQRWKGRVCGDLRESVAV